MAFWRQTSLGSQQTHSPECPRRSPSRRSHTLGRSIPASIQTDHASFRSGRTTLMTSPAPVLHSFAPVLCWWLSVVSLYEANSGPPAAQPCNTDRYIETKDRNERKTLPETDAFRVNHIERPINSKNFRVENQTGCFNLELLSSLALPR